MTNSIFFLEYGPLLSRTHKSSFLVYSYYNAFKNDQDIAEISYKDLNEHLGLATSTIKKANAILAKIGLIELVKDDKLGNRYRLLEIKRLDTEARDEILTLTKTATYDPQTSLTRNHLVDKLPPEFQQMLVLKNLKACQKEIGNLRDFRKLCGYFKVDYRKFKRFYDRTDLDFEKELVRLVEKIGLPTAKKKKVPSKVLGNPEARDLAKYLYDKLSDLGCRPVDKKWFVKNSAIATGILENMKLEDAKRALDWGFKDQWWRERLTSLNPMVFERYNLQSNLKKGKLKKEHSQFELSQEIRQKLSEIDPHLDIVTIDDASMLRQSYLDGHKNPKVERMLAILEESGIINMKENCKEAR